MRTNPFSSGSALLALLFSIVPCLGGANSPDGLPRHSLQPLVLLPDGSEFTTWEATTRFTRTYYVSAANPRASDQNPGSKASPFATINHAAQILQPGERVVVGPGIYRERIRPARGGLGPARMISYEAEPGAQVILRGSRVFAGPWKQISVTVTNSSAQLWSALLDPKLFDGYEPFELPNVTEKQFQTMSWAQPQRGRVPFTLTRGLVFQDGRRLMQVASQTELVTQAGSFWVDRTHHTLVARFFDDRDPQQTTIEITTQETVFAPDQPGLGFIRVQGFIVERAAGPWPWEQVGAISTTRGHHWIIEDCTVRQVNGVGIDLGIQHPRWPQPDQIGFHIVRRNVVTDCGICGICGLGPGRGREFGLLVEDNVVLRNAWHDAELLWETGGIKTHCNVRCLIRRNLVADTRHGPGIWMDWDNRNSRCTQNVLWNNHPRNGAIFVEASTVPNLVDQNIVWGTQGPGIYEHDSRRQIFLHNLIGHSAGPAFALRGKVTSRSVNGQPMTYGAHQVENNLLVANARPDEFRGDPSMRSNNLALSDGVTWDAETLEVKVSRRLPEVSALACPSLAHDFFGNPRTGARVLPGPFASLQSIPASLRVVQSPVPIETESWLRQRLEWFQDLKFGFMMHWGAYSQWGCIESWPLVEVDKWARPDDLPAWVERGRNIERFKRDYWALPKTFNPVKFDPTKWAAAAQAAGMKYVVFTTKHHDGFCMFDTRQTDYRITAPDVPFHTNARSNVVREVFDAFRQDGFAIGAYFSKADWHSPYYWSPDAPARTRNPNYDTLAHPEKWQRFVEFTYRQIEELMTGYGPIDILWLDAGQVRPPGQDIRMDRLVSMARQHQPRLIVVDRTVHGRYENYRTPEQQVPDRPLPYVWETCMTMGDQWSFKPHDRYKSTDHLLHLLVDIVGKGGNFLLNVGPQPNGELPAAAVERMQEIGAWLNVNGDAIYGTRPIAPYKDGQVVFTRKGGTAYAIYLPAKQGEGLPPQISFSGLAPAPQSQVHLLGNPELISWHTDANGRTSLAIPPSVVQSPPCQHAFAFKFEMAQ